MLPVNNIIMRSWLIHSKKVYSSTLCVRCSHHSLIKTTSFFGCYFFFLLSLSGFIITKNQTLVNTFLYLLPCQDLKSNTLLRLCATKAAKKLFAERCGAVFTKQKFAPTREKRAGICGYGKSFSRRRGEFLFVKTCRVRLPSAIPYYYTIKITVCLPFSFR